jgi:hypothetical protein
MKSWLPIFESVDMQLGPSKINLAPPQPNRFTDSQPVTITGEHQGVIPHWGAGNLGSYYELLHLIRSKIFSRSPLNVGQSLHNFQKSREWLWVTDA